MKTELPAIPEFLDMDLLSRLPNLEIQARFLVQGYFSGMHRSPMRGFNVEFKEYRSYEQGDEPRTIDWKVYARTDRLQVKVREEDTNLTAYVLIDASASMDYRSPNAVMSKWDFARSVAAAMILLLHRQRDAASLGVFGSDGLQFIRPTLKTSDQHRMMAALDRRADGNGSSAARTLADLAGTVRRRSLVFVLSDFYEDPAALDDALRNLHYSNCEVIFLHVADPVEMDFDFDSPVLLKELEGQQQLGLSPELLRRQYLQDFEAHRQALSETVCGYGGNYEIIRTDQPPFRALGSYMARRKGAR